MVVADFLAVADFLVVFLVVFLVAVFFVGDFDWCGGGRRCC